MSRINRNGHAAGVASIRIHNVKRDNLIPWPEVNGYEDDVNPAFREFSVNFLKNRISFDIDLVNVDIRNMTWWGDYCEPVMVCKDFVEEMVDFCSENLSSCWSYTSNPFLIDEDGYETQVEYVIDFYNNQYLKAKYKFKVMFDSPDDMALFKRNFLVVHKLSN